MDRLTTAALYAQLSDPQPLPTISADSVIAAGRYASPYIYIHIQIY